MLRCSSLVYRVQANRGTDSGPKDSLHDGAQRDSSASIHWPLLLRVWGQGWQKGPVCLSRWLCKGMCIFYSFKRGRGFWPGHLHPGCSSSLWRALSGENKSKSRPMQEKHFERLWCVNANSPGRSWAQQQAEIWQSLREVQWEAPQLQELGDAPVTCESRREISERHESYREWIWPLVWLIFLCVP